MTTAEPLILALLGALIWLCGYWRGRMAWHEQYQAAKILAEHFEVMAGEMLAELEWKAAAEKEEKRIH